MKEKDGRTRWPDRRDVRTRGPERKDEGGLERSLGGQGSREIRWED